MEEATDTGRILVRGRRRTANACVRCRQQKIKCSGRQPCVTCVKRGSSCVFDNRQSYTHAYVRELERRLAVAEEQNFLPGTDEVDLPQSSDRSSPTRDHQLISPSRDPQLASPRRDSQSVRPIHTSQPDAFTSRGTSNEPFINDMATGRPFYLLDIQGRPVYLGTSSNWSFSRRVLKLAQESIMKAPLTPNSLLWEGQAYNLGWDGDRSKDVSDSFENNFVLPESDYAVYLVNAVKFYVGQVFHVFDEDDFMSKLNRFHTGTESETEELVKSIWYNHYLLLLAFGKAFVAREKPRDQNPPGGIFFVRALAMLSDLTFVDPDPLETVEVLCCAALYLHCLDMRRAAYKLIGQAVRTALEKGMHTTMQHLLIPEHTLERSRRIWWTAVILDRHISASCGLPLAVRDDEITAPLPVFSGSATRALALNIHVKLSKITAAIMTNVYGREGRQSSKFLVHTKAALKDVAAVTDELNTSFPLGLQEHKAGVSRVSAYLHLLQHQCIILATRPVLFNFLEARLARVDQPPKDHQPSENIWALLKICKDSALHMLRILCTLQAQDLLENFLFFDLDAASCSTTVLQMAAHIDPDLLDDHRPWNKMALSLMDEMSARGNRVAANLRLEVEKLDKLLERLPPRQSQVPPLSASIADSSPATGSLTLMNMDTMTSNDLIEDMNRDWLNDTSLWHDHFDAEQMKVVANSIDLDGIDWWFDRDYESVLQV